MSPSNHCAGDLDTLKQAAAAQGDFTSEISCDLQLLSNYHLGATAQAESRPAHSQLQSSGASCYAWQGSAPARDMDISVIDREGGTAHLQDIYCRVTEKGAPNFRGARVPLTTNLHINQCNIIAATPEDKVVVEFLQYGFPAGYCSAIPTNTVGNHSSATNHILHMWIST